MIQAQWTEGDSGESRAKPKVESEDDLADDPEAVEVIREIGEGG